MPSFRAKIGWERPRKGENKKNRSNEFLLDPEQRIPKKIAKKFKKLKYTVMASFQARRGWEWLTKRKNKKQSFR